MAPKTNKERSTFRGTPNDVAAALKPLATSSSFLKKPARLESRHQRQKRIVSSGDVLIAIKSLQDNLSIPRKCMETAFGLVVDDASWSVDDRKEWVKTTCTTLRNNCRFAQQAVSKIKMLVG